MKIEIPLKKPQPDFELLVKVIKGEKKTDKVLMAELLIDEEIKKIIIEKYFGKKNIPSPRTQRFGSGGDNNSILNPGIEYIKNYQFYHRNLLIYITGLVITLYLI